MQHQNRSQANILIENRQTEHKILWAGPNWQWLRIIFLSCPENRGGCIWCGNIATVVCHPGCNDVYRNETLYLDFKRAGAYPMCGPCNNAERQNKILCPRCRQQGHYIAAGIDGHGDGQVCWSCKSPEEKERLRFGKEQKIRKQNEHQKDRYKKAHPTKKEVNPKTGTWVSVRR